MIGFINVIHIEAPLPPIFGHHLVQQSRLSCVAKDVLFSAGLSFPVLGPMLLVSADDWSNPRSPVCVVSLG